MKFMSRRVGVATALAIALTATGAAPANASDLTDDRPPVSVISSAATPVEDTMS